MENDSPPDTRSETLKDSLEETHETAQKTTELRAQARTYALQRLNRREYSSQEVLRYLTQKKAIPAEIASETIEKLQSLNWLSDERYARLYIRDQVGRGKGPHFIQQKLREKGIQLELVEIRALSEEAGQCSELETAKKLVTRRYPRARSSHPDHRDAKETFRALQALMRRGFSYSVAREAVNSPEEDLDLATDET